MSSEINLGKHTVTQGSLLDAIRNSASDQYAASVPLANSGDISRTVEAITGNARNFSEFFDIITRIGRANIDAAYWRDPLDKNFNKGALTEGDSVQNIMVGMAAEHAFSFADANKVFQIEKPDVSALYSTVNRHSKYKVSVSMPEARRILLGPNGVENLYNRIMESLRSAAERDNTKGAKEIINRAIENGVPYFVEVKNDASGNVDYKDLVKKMRYYYTMMTYVDNPDKYNAVGMENPTRPENVDVLLPAITQASTDVDVLASAFNMDRADFIGHQIPINALDNTDVISMMLDRNFIQIYDQLDQSASIFNPEVLTEQNFLHIWKSYSYVKFYNAICFVKEGSKLLDYNFTKFHFENIGDMTVNAKKETQFNIVIPSYLRRNLDKLKPQDQTAGVTSENLPFTVVATVETPDIDETLIDRPYITNWNNQIVGSGSTLDSEKAEQNKATLKNGKLTLKITPQRVLPDGLYVNTVAVHFIISPKTGDDIHFDLTQQVYLNGTTM